MQDEVGRFCGFGQCCGAGGVGVQRRRGVGRRGGGDGAEGDSTGVQGRFKLEEGDPAAVEIELISAGQVRQLGRALHAVRVQRPQILDAHVEPAPGEGNVSSNTEEERRQALTQRTHKAPSPPTKALPPAPCPWIGSTLPLLQSAASPLPSPTSRPPRSPTSFALDHFPRGSR